MLRSLKVENFGPHEYFEDTFPEGVSLVTGKNGAGKSNLVYAIGWAIQGSKALPPEYKQTDIIRDGVDSCRVEVVIDILGEPHCFVREYDGRAASVTVYVGDEEVATTPSGVDDYLRKIGLDAVAFSILCSKQRDLDTFVHATPGARKKIFDSLLRVGVIEDARKLAMSRSKDAKKRAKWTPLPDHHQDIVDRTASSIETYKSEIEALIEDRIELEGQWEKIKEAANSSDAEAYKNAVRRVAEFEAQVNICKTEMGVKQRELDHALSIFAKLEEPEKEAVAYAEAAVEEAKVEFEKIEREISSIRIKIDQIKAERRLLEEAASISEEICFLCGSKSPDGIKTDYSDHRQETLAQLEDDLKRSTFYITEFRTALAQAEDNLRKTKEQVAFFERMQETIKRTESDIDDWLGILEKRESDLMAAKEDLYKLPEPENVGTEVADSLQLVYNNLERRRAELHDAQLRLQELQQEQQKNKEQKEQYEQLIEEYEVLHETAGALRKFRNKTLKDALTWVSRRMTDIMREFSTFEEVTDTAELVLDDRLHFYFEDAGRRVPIYRFSGGQKAVFSIFLRVALSDYLVSRLGMDGLLLLDAVFDGVDEENVTAAARALEAIGPRQSFIFSHFDVPTLEAHRIELNA